MNYGIGNVKDKSKSLFTTTTTPTESGGVITLATTDIVESGFKVGDYLAYVDSGSISALYSISAISSGTATLTLIGAFGGGGKQLYQHNIQVYGVDIYGYRIFHYITIVNDKAMAYNWTSFKAWLIANYPNGTYNIPCDYKNGSEGTYTFSIGSIEWNALTSKLDMKYLDGSTITIRNIEESNISITDNFTNC